MKVSVLSLFDGMACGMLAMQSAGIEVEKYTAYEIDKYAMKVASHNFPMIEQKGDVFAADFTHYEGVDFVVGGSPCTYWSIAQKNNRETEASGMGWELFSQYVRAIHEAKPRFFIYENNKSMSKEIRASIDKAFGFEAVHINSALVSAQNRQRLYWVGKREEDGSYSKVPIEQPEDRGILLRDILDGYAVGESKEKAYVLTAGYANGSGPNIGNYAAHTLTKKCKTMVAEPVAGRIVGRRINEQGHRDDYNEEIEHVQRYEVNDNPGKTNCVTTVTKDNMVAEPVGVGYRNRREDDGELYRRFETHNESKANAMTTVQTDCMVAEPVCMRYERTEEAKIVRKQYEAGELKHGFHELHELHPREDGKTNTLSTVLKDNQICEPVRIGTIESEAKNTDHDSKQYRVCSPDGKSTTICGQGGGVGAKTRLYAVPYNEMVDGKSYALTGSYYKISEAPTSEFGEEIRRPRVIQIWTGEEKPIYEVLNGLITIKDKQYPIKLADGYYIIRKLTVSECKRLQTVPEWYDFSVISNSQAYKCLGNGWTVEVIAHLLRGIAEQGKVE